MLLSGYIYLCILFLTQSTFCQEDTSICTSQITCDSCIKANYMCKWCKDEKYGDMRCGTDKELQDRRCKSIEEKFRTIEKSNSKIVNEYFTIDPESVNIVFTKNSTVTFEIKVVKKKDYLSEVMFVIDYSYTMGKYINKVKELITTFVEKKDSYKVTKIGIMKYIDKVAHPIINIDTLNQPNPPFYIELMSSLVDNSADLLNKLQNSQVGRNVDIPEASLDAVTECAVCKEKIGWSNTSTVLKTIFLFTDATSKFQGNGRMIGVITPHDLKCHIDENGKILNGLDFDFVSPGQAGKALRDNNIQIVMVVPKKLLDYYKYLGKSWRGVRWLVTELNGEQMDLGKILQDSNNILNSVINMYFDKTPDAEISINVKCPVDSIKTSDFECSNVTNGAETVFSIHAKLLRADPSQTINFKISSVETVKMIFTEVKGCDCVAELTNSKCNDGKMRCGICECNSGKSGGKCQCNAEDSNLRRKCMDPKSRLICSNRGICDACGDCICRIANDGEVYSGDHCQCSRAMCAKIDGVACGGPGKGSCVCDKCVCNSSFAGVKCDIPNCHQAGISQKCIKQGENKTCSGNGECHCGLCHCPLDRSGTYCETISLQKSCNSFEDEVNCFVRKVSLSSSYICIPNHPDVTYGKAAVYLCSMTDKEGCTIQFNFEQKTGTNDFLVQVKELISEIDCPKPLNVAALAGAVFGILLAIGLVIIGLYVLITILYYRAEAKRFDQEVLRTQNTGEINPLFKSMDDNTVKQEYI